MNSTKLLEYYVRATENEISIDNSQYKLMHLNSRVVACMPRPSRWLGVYKQYTFLFSIGAHFFRILWIAIAGNLYSLHQGIVFFNKWKKLRASSCMHLHGNFILAFSYRSSKILPHILKTEYEVITMPWEPTVASSKNKSICSLVSINDIILALYLSIIVLFYMIIKGKASYMLQTFTSFRWFVAYLGMSKLKGHFYIANHYDRWAVLADLLAEQSLNHRADARGNNEIILTLVQHGVLSSLSMDDSRVFEVKLPYKLANVRELFVYDQNSRDVFTTYILRKQCYPVINYYKPSISTIFIGCKDVKKILFVGHPLSEGFHCRVEELLRDEQDIELYYKPHPKNPSTAVVDNRKWVLVKNVDTFPVVDYLVSYPSTLVDEYANIGISAFLHPLHIKDSDMDAHLELFAKWYKDQKKY